MLKRVSKKKLQEAILRRKYEMREDIHEVINDVADSIESEAADNMYNFLNKNMLIDQGEKLISEEFEFGLDKVDTIYTTIDGKKEPEVEINIDFKNKTLDKEVNDLLDKGEISSKDIDYTFGGGKLTVYVKDTLPHIEDVIGLKNIKDFVFKVYLQNEDKYDSDISSLKNDVLEEMSKSQDPENFFKVTDMEDLIEEINSTIRIIEGL